MHLRTTETSWQLSGVADFAGVYEGELAGEPGTLTIWVTDSGYAEANVSQLPGETFHFSKHTATDAPNCWIFRSTTSHDRGISFATGFTGPLSRTPTSLSGAFVNTGMAFSFERSNPTPNTATGTNLGDYLQGVYQGVVRWHDSGNEKEMSACLSEIGSRATYGSMIMTAFGGSPFVANFFKWENQGYYMTWSLGADYVPPSSGHYMYGGCAVDSITTEGDAVTHMHGLFADVYRPGNYGVPTAFTAEFDLYLNRSIKSLAACL